ncbi:hypothetical protein LguiB_011777 [Lonicera macranthoides]
MAANPLLQQIAGMRKSFLEEKLLDAQFVQLEELEDDNPNFVEEVFDMYFKDSAETINSVEQELVGASMVTMAINCLRAFLAEGNLENYGSFTNMSRCWLAFEQMCLQHKFLHDRLEPYFELKRRAQPVEIEDDEQPEWDEESSDE